MSDDLISNRPRVTFRLPEELRQRLSALADVSGLPMYKIVEDAFEDYWKKQDADLRDRAYRLLALRLPPKQRLR